VTPPSDPAVPTDRDLTQFFRVIGQGDTATATQMLQATPALATTRLGQGSKKAKSVEFFIDERLLQIYTGHTALHVAAATYDADFARRLVAGGADVRARNRRGAEPLHAATHGGPGSTVWDPPRQAAIIHYLVSAGADPDARASGGITPLHRAVRNRCTAAVQALLDAGADADLPNDHGSTALSLAHQTTGRGGTGSAEAKAEQAQIIGILESRAKA
jgi:hypothetical protein